MRLNNKPHSAIVSFAVLVSLAVSGCGDKPAGAPPGMGGMPPPEVGVITIQPEALRLTTELPGRVDAIRVAQVRARIPGIVLQRVFREGSDVKAGDVLFRIDPAPLKALYGSTEAAVARAEATLTTTTLKAERYKPLLQSSAISKQEYDDAIAAQKQAAADVAAAKAQRQTAGLNLGYATVTAPISGRIGRALVTEGALVGQGEATPLAVIQQLNPIYVNVTQSSADLLRLRQSLANGQLKSLAKGEAKVTLVTEDDRPYNQSGKLLFSDLTVDQSTGTVTLRAEFPNPERLLLPGMYVRTRLEQGVASGAITVPQQAVSRTPDGASVLVVGPKGEVSVRPVKTASTQGNQWVISSGLQAGDQVIVDGLQKAKPGGTVKPVPWQAAAAASTTSAPPATPAAPAAPKPQSK